MHPSGCEINKTVNEVIIIAILRHPTFKKNCSGKLSNTGKRVHTGTPLLVLLTDDNSTLDYCFVDTF